VDAPGLHDLRALVHVNVHAAQVRDRAYIRVSRQLLRHVYLPSATAWVFASLHSAVGMAFVGAVVGEYLGSASGVGYLILQAEGTFDINTVMAGILVLTAFALVLDWVVGVAEKRLMKWQPRSGETEKL
jgi:NitT/TauT family transport system permease protein